MFFWQDVGFQCARVSAQKNTMRFRKSTVSEGPEIILGHSWYGQFPFQHCGFLGAWLERYLNVKGWNSQVHRGFPGKFESSNLGRDLMLVGRLAVAVVTRLLRFRSLVCNNADSEHDKLPFVMTWMEILSKELVLLSPKCATHQKAQRRMKLQLSRAGVGVTSPIERWWTKCGRIANDRTQSPESGCQHSKVKAASR